MFLSHTAHNVPRRLVGDIKEALCYIALDFDEELSKDISAFEQDYQLPDGQVLTVGDERFRAPEALYNPSLLELEEHGIHELAYNSILKVCLALCELLLTLALLTPLHRPV